MTADTLATATCEHCNRPISHGGSEALAGSEAPWFGEDDDFMCPDGEQAHQPQFICFGKGRYRGHSSRCWGTNGHYWGYHFPHEMDPEDKNDVEHNDGIDTSDAG